MGVVNDPDLLKRRQIYLDGEITHLEVEIIWKNLALLNARDEKSGIRLYIRSIGGDPQAGLTIYDALRHFRAPVTGVVHQQASSVAAVVLQGCAERQMMRNAVIRLHLPRVNIALGTDEEILASIVPYREIQDCLYEHIARRTGQSVTEVAQWCAVSKKFSADEALKANLVDRIICG